MVLSEEFNQLIDRLNAYIDSFLASPSPETAVHVIGVILKARKKVEEIPRALLAELASFFPETEELTASQQKAYSKFLSRLRENMKNAQEKLDGFFESYQEYFERIQGHFEENEPITDDVKDLRAYTPRTESLRKNQKESYIQPLQDAETVIENAQRIFAAQP